MSKSEDYLKTIKKRMGWQVGLQTATLFAIGGINTAIKEECGIISSEIMSLSEKTSKGLDNVKDAVQSLEASLIYGIEEIKWLLGSIDDKLKLIIGLIQFPSSTESNEKYLIGYELFKAEYYNEAIEQFDIAIKLSPLNLNARVGLYLSKLKTNNIADLELLFEIAKLTNSDFYIHKEVTQNVRDASIKFFTNFIGSQLCNLLEYRKWIELYYNTIPEIAKRDLTNKIRLIEALIYAGEDYTSLLTDLFDEGLLNAVLFGINYKETKEFEQFISYCFNLSKERLKIKNIEDLKFKYELPVMKSLKNFNQYVTSKEGIFAFGKAKRSIANKNNLIESIYLLIDNIPQYYELLKENEKNFNSDISSIKNININIESEESDEFLLDSFKMILDQYLKIIEAYKESENKKIIIEKEKTINQLIKFEKKLPVLPDQENEFCSIINKYFSDNSNAKNQKIDFEKCLEELLNLESTIETGKNESENDNENELEYEFENIEAVCQFCEEKFDLDYEEIKLLVHEKTVKARCPHCEEINVYEYDNLEMDVNEVEEEENDEN